MSDLAHRPDEIRPQIRDINVRAHADEVSRQQRRTDPMGGLSAAGLEPDTARTVVALRPPEEEEVAGYRLGGDGTCWAITISSLCPGRCFVTEY